MERAGTDDFRKVPESKQRSDLLPSLAKLMTIHAATPYLILNGRADEAIAHYRNALDATVTALQRFGDNNPNCPEALRDNVMHGVLQVGAAILMLSDGPGHAPVPTGGAVNVALQLDDAAQAHRAFGVLADGGTTVQPLIAAPWGALFGAVVDRYGVQWMFNCEEKKG